MSSSSLCSYMEAKNIIEQGDLLIYPTETYYALGCSIYSSRASDIYTIKQRPLNKALPIIVHSIEQAQDFALLSERIKEIFITFPELTIVVPLHSPIQYSQGNTVALRLANTPLLRYLTESSPVFATSANKAQYTPTADYTTLESTIVDILPLCIPYNKEDEPRGIAPSTIICIDNDTIIILREGNISKDDLYNLSIPVISIP